MTVHCLLYLSDAVRDLRTTDLKNILDTAIQFNAEHDVTGILLYRKQCFMQLLEGDKQTVSELYQKIIQDQRHKNCRVIMTLDVPQRNIETWSMGFLHIKEHQINTHYVDFVMHLAQKTFKDEAVLLHQHLLDFAANESYHV